MCQNGEVRRMQEWNRRVVWHDGCYSVFGGVNLIDMELDGDGAGRTQT